MNERSKQIRRDIISLSSANGGYHYGGCFSCVEILIALFDKVIDWRTDDIMFDRLILSKGHACWGYYVLLKELNYNPKLEGHPSYDLSNGVHCSTGSMGHGLPTGIGMAMAKKLKGEEGKIYVLMGDGECQEGTTWESLLIASKYKLDNLVVIIDKNRIQGSGRVEDILPASDVVTYAARSSGWYVTHIIKQDGHDIGKIIEHLKSELKNSPRLISVNTIKGKGISFMEDNPEWHAKWLDDEHKKLAMEELK